MNNDYYPQITRLHVYYKRIQCNVHIKNSNARHNAQLFIIQQYIDGGQFL